MEEEVTVPAVEPLYPMSLLAHSVYHECLHHVAFPSYSGVTSFGVGSRLGSSHMVSGTSTDLGDLRSVQGAITKVSGPMV